MAKHSFLMTRNYFSKLDSYGLAVVSSPLQLLNVNELIEQSSVSKAVVIVGLMSKSPRHYISVPLSKKIISVIYVRLYRPSYHRGFLRIVELQRSQRCVKHILNRASFLKELTPRFVAMGNLNDNLHLALTSLFRDCESYLVDDGMASFRSTISSKQTRFETIREYLGKLNGIFRISFRIQSIRETQTVFSAYRSGDEKKSTLVNDYRWLKQAIGPIKTVNEAWIVGQYLVEADLMNPTDLLKSVEAIMPKIHKGLALKYIMHPREVFSCHHEKLQLLGFQVLHFDAPLEIVMIKHKQAPALAVNFFSTTYMNCKLLFQDQIKFLIVDARQVLKQPINSLINDAYNAIIKSIEAPDNLIVIEKSVSKLSSRITS